MAVQDTTDSRLRHLIKQRPSQFKFTPFYQTSYHDILSDRIPLHIESKHQRAIRSIDNQGNFDIDGNENPVCE
ncbi:hypothetical protein ACFX2I_029580 [Malus domestica]